MQDNLIHDQKTLQTCTRPVKDKKCFLISSKTLQCFRWFQLSTKGSVLHHISWSSGTELIKMLFGKKTILAFQLEMKKFLQIRLLTMWYMYWNMVKHTTISFRQISQEVLFWRIGQVFPRFSAPTLLQLVASFKASHQLPGFLRAKLFTYPRTGESPVLFDIWSLRQKYRGWEFSLCCTLMESFTNHLTLEHTCKHSKEQKLRVDPR